ncbi:MAG: glycosyltransferase family A protein, partial [Patescibacteria group bacterium]|nr:glycosyltransferase family A protein [Patescibacteria group bacterium]
MKKLSIVIPARNEEKTIEKMLEMLLKVDFTDQIQLELIIINDYSSD